MLLPPDVEDHLDEYLDPVRLSHPGLRWVPSARWHLTLEFLGECGPREVERQLGRWATRARRAAPLTLALGGAGAYPRPWHARVLWTGVEVDPGRWRAIAHHEQAAHLTIARTRELGDVTGVVERLATYAGPAWQADDVALVRSHLRPAGERGPRYEVIERFTLGGASH